MSWSVNALIGHKSYTKSYNPDKHMPNNGGVNYAQGLHDGSYFGRIWRGFALPRYVPHLTRFQALARETIRNREIQKNRDFWKLAPRRLTVHDCFHKVVLPVVLALDHPGELLNCYRSDCTVQAAFRHRQSETVFFGLTHGCPRAHTAGQQERSRRTRLPGCDIASSGGLKDNRAGEKRSF